MKPLRKRVALAIDGGGIKGVVVTRALTMVEEHLDSPANKWTNMAVGTSTGAIISAGVAAGLTAQEMHTLYVTLGAEVFRPSLRKALWPLTRYRYSSRALEHHLRQHLPDMCLNDLQGTPDTMDLVLTAFDLIENRTLFIKPWKANYAEWSLIKAVLASCIVPTYFSPLDGRYIDGGVGSYANPAYVAAYEACIVLGWDLEETTLISLGTGRHPHALNVDRVNKFRAWQWIEPVLGAFLQSAHDQQVHLVDTFFDKLDFRRFQVDLHEPIAMDDPTRIPELTAYGEELGRKILNDEFDRAMHITPDRPAGR
jgi:patatin-like phospholipase/acyl hydrolase